MSEAYFYTYTNMNTEIEKKMQRFVELSMIFSLSEKQIFSEEERRLPENYAYIGMSVGTDGYRLKQDCSCSNQSSTNIPTRGERIFNEGAKRAQLSDDFDEYLSLREALSEYFKSLNNLTQ